MGRSSRRALPALLLVVVVGLWLAACRGAAGGVTPVAERAVPVEATAALQPTPTLAAPGDDQAAPIEGDPLRPPTPVVLPSATPLGAPAEAPDEAAAAVGADGTAPLPGEALELAAGGQTTAPLPTVPLPPDATAPELLALGQRAAAEGDHPTAAAAFRAATDAGGLGARAAAEARLGYAVALFDDGQYAAAAEALEALLQEPDAAAPATRDALVAPVDIPDAAAFYLGRARAALGDHAAAIDAFRAYAEANPDMAAYVQPRIADAHLALGDTNAVITALEAATTGAAQRFVVVENRGRLAGLLLARGDTTGAIAQYDAIRDVARTEATKGQMTYLAGLAEQQAGNTAAAQARFLAAITDYPRAAESHAALVALVEAGVPVDEYQRGVINFYAGAYQLGIDALRRAIAAAPETYPRDAHLFLAWNYEKLGDLTSALAELDAFADHEPARALFERGEMLNRAGRVDEALAAYDEFVTEYPDAAEAAAVQWTAAQLADGTGNAADAAGRYVALADAFPFDGNAPAALYRAAELTDDEDGAVALWQRLAEQYPANEYGAAALFRLLRLADAGEAEGLDAAALRRQVSSLTPSNYFALRAIDFAAGTEPFSAASEMVLPDDPADGQAAAELWLRERLVAAGVVPPEALGALSAGLAAEPGRRIGEKLWQLGLYEAAKAELETVREAYADDPVANYQLALYFQELGLYRSSIIAAASLLRQVGATVFDAPRFLGRLAYPAHYADLILPLAERYGYDPRLQFALVRQESLFESIARSTAAAQGLSQVIPDTGAWIAQRLAWPDFTNDDLFKPYVGLNFGAYYLSEQLRNFDGQVHAALAAYNAGPGNAARWAETAGADHDRFFDTVDFTETRLYIERIYEGFNAYRHLYGSEQ